MFLWQRNAPRLLFQKAQKEINFGEEENYHSNDRIETIND